MSLIPTNGPEETPGTEATPGNEVAPCNGSSDGQEGETPLRRIPNLGHALVFVGFTGLLLILLELVLVSLGRAPGAVHGGVTTLLHPKLQIAAGDDVSDEPAGGVVLLSAAMASQLSGWDRVALGDCAQSGEPTDRAGPAARNDGADRH